MTEPVVEAFQTQLKILKCRWPQSNFNFLVGVSGGADSMAVLHLLANALPLDSSLSIIHVNHGLSPHADDWQSFAAATATSLNLPFRAEKLVLPAGGNLEENARNGRYTIFSKALHQLELAAISTKAVPILVLGHHHNDMAEQYFIRLMRAAGPAGLTGMSLLDQSVLDYWIWRPLLTTTRPEIEAYLSAANLQFVNDESNQNTDFDRNYIRHKVLPILQARWPQALKAIGASQAWCEEAAALAADLAAFDLAQIHQSIACGIVPGLNIQSLLSLPDYRAKNLLRFWLISQGLHQIRATLWPSVQQALASQLDQGQQVIITVDYERGLFLSCAYGVLYLYKNRDVAQQIQIPAEPQQKCWSINQIGVELSVHSTASEVIAAQTPLRNGLYPCGINFQLPEAFIELITCNSIAYFWRLADSQECFQYSSKPYAMRMKKLWQEWQIPKPLRSRWPVLADEKGIVYIPGLNYFATRVV